MSFSQSAYQNRALRTIHAELDFLHETNLLTTSQHSQLLSLLPSPTLTTPAPPLTSPTPLPSTHSSTPAIPHNAYTPPISATPLSEKAGRGPTPQLPPAPPSYTPTALVLSRAEALWAFNGSEDGDLSFAERDTIEVVEKVKEDWWRGRVVGGDGKIGLFPSAYVKETQHMAEGGEKPGSAYGRGGNMMTDVAHNNGEGQQQGKEEKSKLGKNGEKFGKKLGNAAIFGAGATIGGNIVNAIF